MAGTSLIVVDAPQRGVGYQDSRISNHASATISHINASDEPLARQRELDSGPTSSKIVFPRQWWRRTVEFCQRHFTNWMLLQDRVGVFIPFIRRQHYFLDKATTESDCSIRWNEWSTVVKIQTITGFQTISPLRPVVRRIIRYTKQLM